MKLVDPASQARRIYIAGPMTGLPDYNYGAFHAAEAWWTAQGWDVANPAAHFDGDQALPRNVYIRAAIRTVAGCDAIALLPGWRNSPGAVLELAAAQGCELEIFNHTTGLPYDAGVDLAPWEGA